MRREPRSLPWQPADVALLIIVAGCAIGMLAPSWQWALAVPVAAPLVWMLERLRAADAEREESYRRKGNP